jgi:hypothetical protein
MLGRVSFGETAVVWRSMCGCIRGIRIPAVSASCFSLRVAACLSIRLPWALRRIGRDRGRRRLGRLLELSLVERISAVLSPLPRTFKARVDRAVYLVF